MATLFITVSVLHCIGCEDRGIPITPSAPGGNFTVYVWRVDGDVDPGDLRLYIDGRLLMERDYSYNGRSRIKFECQLEEGTHALRSLSRNGLVESSRTFSPSATPWAVVEYAIMESGVVDLTMNFVSKKPTFQ
jgi:hypothetical protein